MTELLWKIILWLRKGELGEGFTDWLLDTKLSIWYNDMQYGKDIKNPPGEVLSARKFFGENINRVNAMADALADEKSKRIYLAMIKYRCTHNRTDRPEYNRRDQYFPKDLVSLQEDEVFVDCGAYTGDTIRSFLKNANYKYKKMIAFEPDVDNIKLIHKLCKTNVPHIIQGAAWNENTIIYFSDGAGSSSKVVSQGELAIQGLAIDSIVECNDATFIKMDIEGSEYNALLGAKETISRNRPILAICIYHSDEDMIRIYELINSWNLGYKFYVRQHAQKISETVLYAIQ